MDLGLHGKRVLVTGGSRGIGAAIARAFAAEGAGLVLVARNGEALERTRNAIRADYPVAMETAIADVSVIAEVERLAARFGDIDILVNNAGAAPGGSLFDVTDARWREGWDSKVFAYISMCRAFYPLLKARGGGVIVNIVGNGSRMKRFDYICGGMANAALDFLTETLGAASPQDGIRVIGISPGPVSTERYRKLAAEREEALGEKRSYPFGRIATPEEVAAMVAFVASGQASYVSGSIITIDGGMSASRERGRRTNDSDVTEK
jgi:NAD(P)-dependent dehydrogenase (short-subunit alcohol dehydrogenase family)